jgi:Tol biopolymer transport system component
MKRNAAGGVWLAGAAAMLMGGAALADHAGIQLISRGWTWEEATFPSSDASVSPDGNFIGFTYRGDDLSPDDNNLADDIYLYDRTAETCILVSANPAGQAGNGHSRKCSVSQDGRFVAFQSDATNLVAGDENAASDVFVKDMATGVVQRISVAMGGWESNWNSANPAISAGGRYVAFESGATNLVPNDTNGVDDVFVYDRRRRRTSRVSINDAGAEGNGASRNPRISGDGLWVVFDSVASNLVNNDNNDTRDVFIRPTARPGMARLSVSAAGVEGNGQSSLPSVSSDGRYVAFQSLASNLVPDDTNGFQDIFRVDREAGTITRASVNTAGVEGNDMSNDPVVDDHGRVFFSSFARNLEGDDANGSYDVFVRAPNPFVADTEWTVMISRTPDNDEGAGGSAEPAISADGSVVAFESDAEDLVQGDSNVAEDIFFRTLGNADMGPMQRASVTSAHASTGNDHSFVSDISSNGRFVIFNSAASNLVADDTNGFLDIFLVDRWLGTITRANVNEIGQEANGASGAICQISPNGDYWVFTSEADNLGGVWPLGGAIVYVKNRQTGEILQAIGPDVVAPDAACLSPDATDAGGVVFYSSGTNVVPGDTNGTPDVFYAEPATMFMERVSIGHLGQQGNGDSDCPPAVTPDGRYVVFASDSTNLIDGGTPADTWHVYLRDRTEATTTLISRNAAGIPGHSDSAFPHISDDGSYVAFESEATNLVDDDTNGRNDIFVFDRNANTVVRASVNDNGDQADGDSFSPRLSGDGRYVAFFSAATNLVADDTNGIPDVFVRDLYGNRTVRVSMGGSLGNLEASSICQLPAISNHGRHVVFTTLAPLQSTIDDNAAFDIYLALNYQPALAPGMTFPLSPGEVEGIGEATFGVKPKMALAYEDPVKFRPARKSVKVRPTVYPADEVDGEWKSRVALLSPKVWPWNAMVCREAMDNYFVVGQAVIGDLRVTATRGGGTRVEDVDAGEKAIVPPEITLVRNNSAGGDAANVVEAGDELQVNGGFFGPKPKAWLEYVDAKGKLKQLKCKVAPGREDANGKASCMGPNGNGNMWVTIPAKWPKGWVHGRHDLVIDNGCGRACSRLVTSP